MTPLRCVNLLTPEELLCRWDRDDSRHHAVQIRDTLRSWRSLWNPACPKVFLTPTTSLHKGFRCNWEAGLFYPDMRCLSELCRGLLNHHSNVISIFQICREHKAVSIAAVPAAEQKDHLERLFFYTHHAQMPVMPRTAQWSHKLECVGVCPEQ